jgi:hypothetical protein
MGGDAGSGNERGSKTEHCRVQFLSRLKFLCGILAAADFPLADHPEEIQGTVLFH